MPSRYEKGRRLEYAVKRRLEAAGYTVFRCAASRPCDLIAIKQESFLLVECKSGHSPYAPQHGLKQLAVLANTIGAKAILVLRKDRHAIRFYEIAKNRMQIVKSCLKILG